MSEPFIDTSGPSLGALALYTKTNDRDSGGNLVLKPVWRLYNHQGPDWQYAQATIQDPASAVSFQTYHLKAPQVVLMIPSYANLPAGYLRGYLGLESSARSHCF